MTGEFSVFDPGPRTSTVTAATGAPVAVLARGDLLAWGTSRPHVAAWLLQVLGRRLRRINSTVVDLMFVDVAGRVANVLLELAARFGERHGPPGAGAARADPVRARPARRRLPESRSTRSCPIFPAAAGSEEKTVLPSCSTYPASPNGPASPAAEQSHQMNRVPRPAAASPPSAH